MRWRLKSPSSPLFTQPFIRARIQENTKARAGNLPVNSPHKWPVTRKMFPFDGVIMWWWNLILTLSTLIILCVWRSNRPSGFVAQQTSDAIPWCCSPRHRNIELCDDDVIKLKHFPRHWPFVRGIHRSPVNSPHKGQWRGALMFPLISTWISGWVNNRTAGDLGLHHTHYDVTVI